jgi:hypothetical protein
VKPKDACVDVAKTWAVVYYPSAEFQLVVPPVSSPHIPTMYVPAESPASVSVGEYWLREAGGATGRM